MNFFKLFKNRQSKNDIVRTALSCKGWSTELQLSTLFDLLQDVKRIDGVVVEIGSAWGRSTILLAKSTNKLVWSIDPHSGGLLYLNSGTEQNSYDEFLENLIKHNVRNRVQVIKNTTENILKNNLFPNNSKIAFAFVDGLHTAEGVKKDLEFLMPRLSKHGIVVFDDYFKPSVIDMKEMIDSIMLVNKQSLILDEESQFAYFINK